jgi:magnesium transporter
METTTRLILPDVIEALRAAPDALLELCDELHPADLADLAAALEPGLARKLLDALPVETGARLLEHLDEARRAVIFADLAEERPDKATALTDEMAADDRADLYGDLGEELRTQLLGSMDAEESRDIRQLLSYAESTAGALMTTDFVALPADATAAGAIEIVRATAERMESSYHAYAVDEHGTLLGVISLRDLVTSPAARPIAEIMNPNLVSVGVDEDQEDVARLIAKYDLLALPVVDRHHKIVGMITVDDAIDVVAEEATEDVQRLGGVEPLSQPYLEMPFFGMLRKRAGWLSALFLGEMLTATAMARYETQIERAVVLTLFLPLIISSGGNSGSQATTLVIRAMALGEVTLKDWWRVARREVASGLSLGLVLAAIGFLRIVGWQAVSPIYGEHYVVLAATVALSLLGVVLFGTIAGSLLPLGLRRLGLDPASASAPFVATLVDVSGLVIYFTLATLMLTGTIL